MILETLQKGRFQRSEVRTVLVSEPMLVCSRTYAPVMSRIKANKDKVGVQPVSHVLNPLPGRSEETDQTSTHFYSEYFPPF